MTPAGRRAARDGVRLEIAEGRPSQADFSEELSQPEEVETPGQRTIEGVSEFLGVTKDDAFRVQKDYYKRYGTSMRGMMTEHGVHADDYLAYVHQIDHSPLQPTPAMGAAIAKLPGRKLILTNGSTDHADKVLERLGIGAHFEAVFDIIAAGLEPKPAPQTYQKFLRDHGVDPTRSAMFSFKVLCPLTCTPSKPSSTRPRHSAMMFWRWFMSARSTLPGARRARHRSPSPR